MTNFNIIFAQLRTDYFQNKTVNPMKLTALKAMISENDSPEFDYVLGIDFTPSEKLDMFLDSLLADKRWEKELMDSEVSQEEMKQIETEIKLARIPFVGNALCDLYIALRQPLSV